MESAFDPKRIFVGGSERSEPHRCALSIDDVYLTERLPKTIGIERCGMFDGGVRFAHDTLRAVIAITKLSGKIFDAAI